MTRSTAETWRPLLACVIWCVALALLADLAGWLDLPDGASVAAFGVFMVAWQGPELRTPQDAWERRFTWLLVASGGSRSWRGSPSW